MLADIQLLLPELWEQIDTFRQGLMEIIKNLLLRGQQEGSINPDIDPEVVGKILQGVMLRLADPQFLISNGLSIEQLVSNWQSIMLYGVLTQRDRR